MIKVHLQPRPTRARRADKVFGVFSFRYDAHLVPGLLANIEPLVDGWVSYDDRGSRCEFSDEPARRHLLLEAAKSAGAQWALVADPDERFETRLVDAIDSLVSAKGQIAYAFAVRELFTPNAYRVDGLWGRKSQTKLFRLPSRLAASPSPLHSPWHELVPGVQLRESGFNLYHLKMITPERRRARAALYRRLDPTLKYQPIGYDYLADDRGAVLETIPEGRGYHPEHIEDGGLWMPAASDDPAPR
jgi:hypothetical protein